MLRLSANKDSMSQFCLLSHALPLILQASVEV